MHDIAKSVLPVSFLALMLAGLAGCATINQIRAGRSERYCYRNKLDLCIVVMDAEGVAKACSGAKRFDDGELITAINRDRILACWYPISRTMYIVDERSIIHELCHVDEQPTAECDKIH